MSDSSEYWRGVFPHRHLCSCRSERLWHSAVPVAWAPVTIALQRWHQGEGHQYKLNCSNYFSNSANDSGTELKMFLSERVKPQKATYFFLYNATETGSAPKCS